LNLRDLPLGRLIVRDGIAHPDDVHDALVEAQESDRRLGEVLLERGLIRERDLSRLLAEQEALDFVDLGLYDLDEDAANLLPEAIAQAHGVVAFRLRGGFVTVAVGDPTDDAGMEVVRKMLGRRVRFVVATPSEVAAAQREAYGEQLAAPAEQLS
jgi:type IV pilus assembly protein PilB